MLKSVLRYVLDNDLFILKFFIAMIVIVGEDEEMGMPLHLGPLVGERFKGT